MIGNMRRRYSVRGRPKGRNASGERNTHYQHKFFIWGEAPREGTTNVRGEGGTLISTDTLRLRTRYRGGIGIGDQLVDGDTTLYVQSVLDLEGRRRYLQLVATLSPGAG